MNTPRLRFAPSPTGQVHIGSLRTALFNYIIAKKLGAKLILRIEDTDEKREVDGAVDNLLRVMNWAGIIFDEGPHVGGEFGPYTQSERLEIYKKYYNELIELKKAYYCFCSPERLDIIRTEQQANKQAPRYDKHCRDLSQAEIDQKIKEGNGYVIRQKMPLDGLVEVKDRLRGKVTFKAADLEDHVLVKSNGVPTYHFANVIDDHLMQVTLVIRGEEWLPSLPKNILLYQDFGWTPPEFLHMSLMLNKNGGKLSKRHGDVSVESFKEQGYLKEALINFCALQGWHPKEEGKEIYSLDEIIEKFDINSLGTSGSIFETEKLDYINGCYIRKLKLDELIELTKPYLIESIQATKNPAKTTSEFIAKVIGLEQERLKKLSDIKALTYFFFKDELNYEKELLIWKKMTSTEALNNLQELYHALNVIPDEAWVSAGIEEAVRSHIQSKEGKIGHYLWPMRASLTGEQSSPGPFDVAFVLGKKESLERINFGISKLK
ncbi:MAG: glutamate--tRNA ligase [Candidatus Falkowbacteria bacterium]|nr:glutamate--tRNA ligase [Candidatus Falkowbacteria bacterium]